MKESKLLSSRAVFLLGINSIIGSGIFLLSGKIYQSAGVWSLLSILLAGLSILVISLSYANMSKIYPENGGAFVYAKENFGRFAGFIVGVLTWLLGVVTISTETSALLTAVKMLFPGLQTTWIGIAIILIFGLVSYFGPSIGALLDNMTSGLKLLIITVFIVSCVWLMKGSHFSLSAVSGAKLPYMGILSAYGTAFYFFTGFSFLPVNAEKMANPKKTLPKMMVAVVLTVIVIYLAVQAITIGVLGKQLPDTAVPAATVFSHVVGNIGIPIIVTAICISILGVIVAVSFNTPTILASLAESHEDVPSAVAKKNRFGTPGLSVLLTAAGAVALFLSGSYAFLAGLTVFMSFVQYLSTGLANIKEKFLWIGIGTIIFSLVLLVSFTGETLIFGFAILAILAVIYLLSARLAKHSSGS